MPSAAQVGRREVADSGIQAHARGDPEAPRRRAAEGHDLEGSRARDGDILDPVVVEVPEDEVPDSSRPSPTSTSSGKTQSARSEQDPDSCRLLLPRSRGPDRAARRRRSPPRRATAAGRRCPSPGPAGPPPPAGNVPSASSERKITAPCRVTTTASGIPSRKKSPLESSAGADAVGLFSSAPRTSRPRVRGARRALLSPGSRGRRLHRRRSPPRRGARRRRSPRGRAPPAASRRPIRGGLVPSRAVRSAPHRQAPSPLKSAHRRGPARRTRAADRARDQERTCPPPRFTWRRAMNESTTSRSGRPSPVKSPVAAADPSESRIRTGSKSQASGPEDPEPFLAWHATRSGLPSPSRSSRSRPEADESVSGANGSPASNIRCAKAVPAREEDRRREDGRSARDGADRADRDPGFRVHGAQAPPHGSRSSTEGSGPHASGPGGSGTGRPGTVALATTPHP